MHQIIYQDGQLWFDFSSDQFTNILVTNWRLSSLNVCKKYRKHAMIKTVIEELKNDFGTGIAHSDQFHVNAAMAVCTVLAYNIKNTFLAKNKNFIRENEIMKLSNFQASWLHTPGILVTNGNRKILKIAKERFSSFIKLIQAA